MVADASSCWRSRTERGFSGNKGLHVRSGAAASCEPARKTVRSEGSLAKPNLCPQSPFFASFLWRSKEKEVPRAGMRRKGEQAGNGEGYLKFGKLPKP